MALHHRQLRSPAAFTFPSSSAASSSRPSARDSYQPPSLAAAFDYPVRGDSLARSLSTHAPTASTSSTASSSSRSRVGDGYSTTRSAVSSTYTAFTSDSYEHDDACDDGYSDAGSSVLDDLYRDFSASRPEPGIDESPPRFHQHSASTDSTMQLRERTRYRSSASLVPKPEAPHPLGAFGSLSLASSSSSGQPAIDSHMALLAALAATSSTLDRCFCGAEPEEDSIYCSRACAQADALNALCGASSSAEDAASSSDAASLRSGSSGSSGGIDSHYRRVEREETRRAKERERAQRREEKERKARTAERERSEADRRRTSGSLHPSEGDVGAARRPSYEVVAPPPRTSSRRTPSLSSSVSSRASSAAPSPVSPAFPHSTTFPPRSSSSSPFIIEPPTASSISFHDASLCAVAEEDAHARPCTPNPETHGHLDASEIYASYLLATPQAGDKLRTPTQDPIAHDLSNSTPRAAFPHTPGGPDDENDESPTQRGAGGAAGIGLRMLELCGSDDEGDECARDEEYAHEVAPLRTGHRRAAPLGGGHTKGKLSFDDVVGIMSG